MAKKNVDILFIIPPFHMRKGGGSFFPLGTGYIISSIELGGYTWEVINCTKIINSFFEKDLILFSKKLKESLDYYNPRVIGIGPCVTTQLKALKIISDSCKQFFPNVPIFAGGPLTSIENQEWLFHEYLGIDCYIKGDGEYAVADVINAVKKEGDIKASKCISYKDYEFINFIEDINLLPFPYREFDEDSYFSVRRSDKSKKQAAMITSRGCPYSCNFCVSGNLKCNNINFRKRSLDNIIDEILLLNRRYQVNDIVFYDDCFFFNPKTLNDDVLVFSNAILSKNIDVTWQIEMRPDIFCLLSNESIKWLFKSGCRQINLGIEKVSNEGLRFLGKNNCWLELEKQICHVKEISNVSICSTFILGGEKETKEDILLLIEKVKKLPLDFAHFNPLFVYPGTPIYNMVFQNEREWVNVILNDEWPWGEIVFENSFLNREQLLDLVDCAYSSFYENKPQVDEPMVYDRFNLKGNRK